MGRSRGGNQTLSDITQESVLARTDHYIDVFVRDNVAHVMTLCLRYWAQNFNADAILFVENKQCNKMVF